MHMSFEEYMLIFYEDKILKNIKSKTLPQKSAPEWLIKIRIYINYLKCFQ